MLAKILPWLLLYSKLWAVAMCFFATAFLSNLFFAGEDKVKNWKFGISFALYAFCLPGALLWIGNKKAVFIALAIISGTVIGMIRSAWNSFRAKNAVVRCVKIAFFGLVTVGAIFLTGFYFLKPLICFGPAPKSKCFGLAEIFACFMITDFLCVLIYWFAFLVWPDFGRQYVRRFVGRRTGGMAEAASQAPGSFGKKIVLKNELGG